MKNHIAHLLYFVLMLFLIVGCTNKENTAFDEVCEYYKNNNDTLKYKAACFLRKYATYQQGVSRYLVDSSKNRVDSMCPLNFKNSVEYRDFLNKKNYNYVVDLPAKDIGSVTFDYLRSNIEQAFDSWKNPWVEKISFEDFCMYILPYRNVDEELSDWRLYFKNKYEKSIFDSVKNVSSIKEVALYLMSRLRGEVSYGTALQGIYFNFLTPKQMEMMHTMECKALAHYGTLALRACGVPCATIETYWRFNEVAHTSILLPSVAGNDAAYRLSIYDDIQKMGQPKDTMASWRTWRYSYEVNKDLKNLLSDKSIPRDYIYPLTRMDETSLFSTTYNLAFKISPELCDKKEHLFLCRFSHWKWFPIRSGEVVGDSVYFKDATIRQWYRMGMIESNTVKTFGETFTIVGDGSIMKYDCGGDTVLFKMVYNCQPDEKHLTRQITTFYWNEKAEWAPITQDAPLWGFNEKKMEWKIFDESMRGEYIPVFHLLQTHLPCRTVFFDNEIPRPLGFVVKDEISNEGYFMQF